MERIKSTEELANGAEVINPIEAQSLDKDMAAAEIDRMLKYSRDTARPLETAYWESKKAELEDRQNQFEAENITMAGINRMIRYAIDTARPLELAYWEAKKREFGREQRVEERSQEPRQEQEQRPKQVEQIKEEPVSKPAKKVEPKERELKSAPTLKKEEVGAEVKEVQKDSTTVPKPIEREIVEIHQAVVEQTISPKQKDAIDDFIEKGEGPAEVVIDLAHKENIEEEVINKAVDGALDEAAILKEYEKTAPQGGTFLKKIRDRLKNKAVIYVGVGLLTLVTLKSEFGEYITKAPASVVKILDKVPDIQIAADFPKMVASEAARYRVAPYLVARYIGSNDYFGLEAIKIADTVGLEGTANGMYDQSLSDYINNFSETRQANRFTTIDKHTVRNYIDTFTQIYAGSEQADSGIKNYQKLREFLQKNFGAAKVYELALKVSSEKTLSPELLAAAKGDLGKQGSILSKALGKSQIYFNQEEGIFNIIHDGQLIDTYSSRAGFMNVPKSAGLKSLGYERTPDGKFTISSIEYGYSTLRWRDSFLPYGAEIRTSKTGEIEYQYRGQWYSATGPEATYFDQGQKIQPNKTEKGKKYLSDRSRGESPLTKLDFYSVDGLMTHWDKNPFGPISYRLAGRPELIHSNPTDSDNILHPSHGCIRLDKEDVKTLEHYIGKGVSKIEISSQAGKTWTPKS